MTTTSAPLGANLVAKTVAIPYVADLLSLLPESGGYAWVRGAAGQQEGLVGWGVLASIDLDGAERFSRAQRWWGTFVRKVAGDQPIAFSSFAFDARPGESRLVVPQVVVKNSGNQTTLTVITAESELESVLAAALNQISQPSVAVGFSGDIKWLAGSLSVDDWRTAVETAVSRISRGELDKVVLARDLVAQLSEEVHVGALLQRLNEAYPECWTFCVDGLVGATPELLVRRDGNEITSRVLAGTVRRSRDNQRDGQLAAKLMDSNKDQEEHTYAVASVAAALAAHCTDLTVPAYPSILRLANVQHLATDVSGQLVDGAPVLALAASLHPTAAVCGTPTERAFSVIRELEQMDRGRYAGPVGWFNADGDGEFGIALRCAQIENENRTQLRLYAGCGIVAGSSGESEVNESQAKFAAMRDALS